MKNILELTGQKLRLSINEFLYFSAFLKTTLYEIFFFIPRKQVPMMVLYRQILFTGFEALKLISLIGLAIGAIIIIQGMSLLVNLGQTDLFYKILITIIVKELGPIITAFIIIARSGTAISTELGNMVVNQEVEALISIGINPISYLVVPRVLGVVVSLFALSIYLNITGLLGGYLVAQIFQPFSFMEFINRLSENLTLKDLISSVIKSIIFGFVIAIISSYHGLKVNYASTEVPQRTIKTVVSSLTWIIIFDIIIAIFTYTL